MQKNIPCDESDWWVFKELAAKKKLGIKEYVHDIVEREKNLNDR